MVAEHKLAGSAARELFVALFSYNRTADLHNALRSWERHAPMLKVVIFDDGSDDKEMQNLLAEVGERHQVIRSSQRIDGPRGGLHGNMQRALKFGIANGYSYGLFTQDDVQVVRQLDPVDFEQIDQAFAVRDGVVQVAPRLVGRARFDPKGAYYPMDPNNAMLDVGIFDLKKLATAEWVFGNSELGNSEAARERGWCRIHMPDPFLAHTPWPRTYWRGKRRLIVSVTDWIVGATAHRFVPMTPDDVRRFRARSRDELPKAEDWLEIEGSALRPWGYMASDWEIRDRLKRTLPSDVREIGRAFRAVFRRSA